MPGKVLQKTGGKELKRKRKSKQKARTVNLSSDSESDVRSKKSKSRNNASKSISPEHIPSQKKTAKPTSASPAPSNESSSSSTKPDQEFAAPIRQKEDFTSIYLRKITAELGDDLVKLRDAGDFTDRSIPLLRHALTQGVSIFSDDEKKRVMSGMNQ